MTKATMKKTYAKKTAEQKEAELRALTEKLETGVSEIQSSERFKQWLETIARFPKYSAKNQMLIFSQNPEAQMVCSYKQWATFGRHVKKGEKALRIFAPRTITVEDENGQKTPHCVGFIAVPVFDISQTEGEPLPEPEQPVKLTGDFEELPAMIEKVEQLTGFTVKEQKHPNALGFTRHADKLIGLDPDIEPSQKMSTLIHECAHVLLHSPEEEGASGLTDSIRETEAEGTAFVVCSVIGLDSKSFAFPYVAQWAETAPRQESLTRISETAKKILEALLPEEPEADQEEPDPAAILEKFNKEYERLYQMDTNGENQLSYSEATDKGDAWILDKRNADLLKAICGLRGDVFMSDRETAALAYALNLI